jgi:hypothetical protein
MAVRFFGLLLAIGFAIPLFLPADTFAQNHDVTFNFVDRQHIKSADNSRLYKLGSLNYERDEPSCRDTIQAGQANTATTGGSLIVRAPDDGNIFDRKNPLKAEYDNYPFKDRIEYDRRENGCYVSKPVPVRVGQANTNSNKPSDPNNPELRTGLQPSEKPECDAGPGFTWAICGMIHTLTSAISGAEKLVGSLLHVSPLQQNDSVHKVWKIFRDLTNALFVLAFLFIIFTNIASINIDAYTVKKTLPKLVVASLLVQFSFYVSAFAVDVTNVVGGSLFGLIRDRLGDVGYNFSSGQSGLTLGIAALVAAPAFAALASAVMSLSILVFLGAAFFGVLAVLLTLIFRQILITTLVALSPIAFVAMILPNTEYIFKLWKKTFLRTLIMYPLISLLLASGMIFSHTAAATGGANSPTALIFSLLGLVVPLFMIPATFKFAGSAMIAGGSALGKFTNMGRNRFQSGDTMERIKNRTAERKIQTAAGEPVKGFGWVSKMPGGRRAAQRAARGMLGGAGDGADVRAMTDLAKVRAGVADKLKKEGLTQDQDAAKILGYGSDWYEEQKSGLRAKGDTKGLERLETSKRMADRYKNMPSARAAALIHLANTGQLDADHSLRALNSMYADDPTGRLVKNQIWRGMRAEMRDTSPELMFQEVDGSFDHNAFRGYMGGQSQPKLSGFKEGTWKKLFYDEGPVNPSTGKPTYTLRADAADAAKALGAGDLAKGTNIMDRLLTAQSNRADAKSATWIDGAYTHLTSGGSTTGSPSPGTGPGGSGGGPSGSPAPGTGPGGSGGGPGGAGGYSTYGATSAPGGPAPSSGGSSGAAAAPPASSGSSTGYSGYGATSSSSSASPAPGSIVLPAKPVDSGYSGYGAIPAASHEVSPSDSSPSSDATPADDRVLFFDADGKPKMISEAMADALEASGKGHVARDSNDRKIRGNNAGQSRAH